MLMHDIRVRETCTCYFVHDDSYFIYDDMCSIFSCNSVYHSY